jgi:hypothetical protein
LRREKETGGDTIGWQERVRERARYTKIKG